MHHNYSTPACRKERASGPSPQGAQVGGWCIAAIRYDNLWC